MAYGEDRAEKMNWPAARFFLLTDIATVLFVIWAATVLTDTLNADRRISLWLAWTLLLFGMLVRRGHDEFWNLCWRQASVAAFAGLLIVPPLYSFSLGFYEGFVTEPAGRTLDAIRPSPSKAVLSLPTDIDHDILLIILFTIFFARFQWTRFRGGMD